VHAHPGGITSWHAHSRAQGDLAEEWVAQPALAVDAASRPQDRAYFETR
jgi:hypothetical protein